MQYSVRYTLLAAIVTCVGTETVNASELSYTFLDFQALKQDISEHGIQEPVLGQTVEIDGQSGDGLGIEGALAIGERFFAGGSFRSSIVDVTGTVTNPLGTTDVTDEFDAVFTRIYAGYILPIGDNFDLTFQLSLDSTDYDFGSFAGESFDTQDSGTGAQLGFRWNPTPNFEIFSYARFSEVGDADLELLQLNADEIYRVGFYWYFFEDLGLGFDYESGAVETAAISMRFSFGNLPW